MDFIRPSFAAAIHDAKRLFEKSQRRNRVRSRRKPRLIPDHASLRQRRAQHRAHIGHRSGLRRRLLSAAADQVAARITLIEIAISKTQAGQRAAEAAVVDLLDPEAWRERQARQMRAHRPTVDPDRAGRQRRKAGLTLTANFYWADHGAVV